MNSRKPIVCDVNTYNISISEIWSIWFQKGMCIEIFLVAIQESCFEIVALNPTIFNSSSMKFAFSNYLILAIFNRSFNRRRIYLFPSGFQKKIYNSISNLQINVFRIVCLFLLFNQILLYSKHNGTRSKRYLLLPKIF